MKQPKGQQRGPIVLGKFSYLREPYGPKAKITPSYEWKYQRAIHPKPMSKRDMHRMEVASRKK